MSKVTKGTFDTAGERLLSRRLEKEMRAGVQHYKPGQLNAHLMGDEEAIFVFLSWVDAMGHAVAMPVVRKPDGEWETMGVYRKAGQEVVYNALKLEEGYELPAATVEFLKKAEESWQPSGN